jgi:hypothetical protein
MPETMNGTTRCQYGVVGVEIAASEPEPSGPQRQSDAHQPRTADPVGESAGDRGDEHSGRGAGRFLTWRRVLPQSPHEQRRMPRLDDY